MQLMLAGHGNPNTFTPFRGLRMPTARAVEDFANDLRCKRSEHANGPMMRTKV